MVAAEIRAQQTSEPLAEFDAAPETVRRIPESLSHEYCAAAIAIEGETLTVAFAAAPSGAAVRRIARATGLTVRPVLAPRERIEAQLARVFGAAVGAIAADTDDNAPAVRAVDRMHRRALAERCSDMHIEPSDRGARIRFRIDGLMRDVEHLPEAVAPAVVSRLKVLAGMDIAERRAPQDGRYTLRVGARSLDARVSSVPAHTGEKIVVRLLDHQTQLPSLDELGMPGQLARLFRCAIELSYGFVVVAGPTGSGKTTTLYAALAHLNTPDRNICTVEDPVERAIPGVTQVQVNARAGVSFASVLRALLRQDPNVLMIGEVRDAETASTAASAALSGQIVFATLHSNDAPRTIDRLVELGLARSSIAAALGTIVAQRLVRRLCIACRRPQETDAGIAQLLDVECDWVHFAPVGCALCKGTGFSGRTGIFEAIAVDDEIRDAVARGASTVAITGLARAGGYRTMTIDCVEKCRAGVTSISELRRVAPHAILQ
jgi:type IV pilus assembly protein PilB